MKRMYAVGLIALVLLVLSGCNIDMIDSDDRICTVDYINSPVLLIGQMMNISVNGNSYGECCCVKSYYSRTKICNCEDKVVKSEN